MQGSHEIVTVEGRFCGPPGVGNGGYVSGLLAERIGAGAQVTLRRPAPLERPLALCRGERAGVAHWTLEDGDEVIAEGLAARPDVGAPLAPSLAEAEAARDASTGWPHPFPGCFVCGPDRAQGDGLNILPGPWGVGDAVAAPWVPERSLADASGFVATRFLWAALDCPGGIAAMLGAPRRLVLGRITGVTLGRIRPAEPCVVVGWRIAHEGRKHTTGTALFTGEGRLCGTTRQVWIEI